MAYAVDWIAKVFTIPQSDLTFLSGTNYLLNVTDLHEEIRRLEWAFADGLWAERIARFYETVTLSGIPKSPSLEIINGYTFNFTGSNYNVVVDGFDTNLFDVYLPANGVSMLAINSVGRQAVGSGLTPVQSDQLASVNNKTSLIEFLGGIVIDEVNGSPGTGLDTDGNQIGSRLVPSDNLADTKTIADNNGFNQIYVASNLGNVTEDFSAGYTFIGDTLFKLMNINLLADLTNCSFENITTIGELDGINTVRESLVLGAKNAGGLILRSELRGSTTVNGPLIVASCYTSGALDFDMATGGQLNITDFHGSISVDNILATDHSIDIAGGSMTIGSGCTGGTLTILGAPYEIVDNSNGTTIIDLTGDIKTRSTEQNSNIDTPRIKDLWQFKGLDDANQVVRSGDGVTSEVLTVDSNVLTITPDDITRT